MISWFEQCGPVRSVDVFNFATGLFNGTCQINYCSGIATKFALQNLNGKMLMGRSVNIRPYDPCRLGSPKFSNKVTLVKRKNAQGELEWLPTFDIPNVVTSSSTNNPSEINFLLKTSVTTEEKIKHILDNCHFTESETQTLIKKKLSNEDTDIQTDEETYKLTLLCPLTRKRLEQPARGTYCLHLECFDLETYVLLGFTSYKWSCPICSKDVNITQLKVDSYLRRIAKESLNGDYNIEILNDFTWRYPEKKQQVEKKDTIMVINICDISGGGNCDGTIVLDDDDDDDKVPTTTTTTTTTYDDNDVEMNESDTPTNQLDAQHPRNLLNLLNALTPVSIPFESDNDSCTATVSTSTSTSTIMTTSTSTTTTTSMTTTTTAKSNDDDDDDDDDSTPLPRVERMSTRHSTKSLSNLCMGDTEMSDTNVASNSIQKKSKAVVLQECPTCKRIFKRINIHYGSRFGKCKRPE
jgi:hypothetical protein